MAVRFHLSRIVSWPVVADLPSWLSQALRDRLSSCETMVTALRFPRASANQLLPAPAAPEQQSVSSNAVQQLHQGFSRTCSTKAAQLQQCSSSPGPLGITFCLHLQHQSKRASAAMQCNSSSRPLQTSFSLHLHRTCSTRATALQQQCSATATAANQLLPAPAAPEQHSFSSNAVQQQSCIKQ